MARGKGGKEGKEGREGEKKGREDRKERRKEDGHTKGGQLKVEAPCGRVKGVEGRTVVSLSDR